MDFAEQIIELDNRFTQNAGVNDVMFGVLALFDAIYFLKCFINEHTMFV